ncbi:probable dihydroxyacetone kinase regulator [Kingella potus]|uniref:Probable dihydroxyacetone kinase regulator n=1 Tax=Kingella potus TaxID=265175 RepID=A0A377R2Q0_9NEIS|nr:TetR family transcriptional regulator [Kingella potus]UOP00428.1 TetR family transcriptional regulator [Kingella potus]STR02504.1 probable dihydroxyacetone kinase regulator [Kingella potus]
MNDKTDLRVVKTHNAIRSAFIELLQAGEYEQIAVQDIIDKALVNRNTFYKYYSGKSDLAGKMIADFKAEYAGWIAARLAGEDVQALIAHAAPLLFEKRRLLLALWKIDTKRHHLYADMHTMIGQAFIVQAQKTDSGKDWAFQTELFATLVLAAMRYHFERDLPLPMAKMPKILREMVDVMGV